MARQANTVELGKEAWKMAILRFQGVTVTEAGQRALGSIGQENARGYGTDQRGQAFRKLERDGLAGYGYGPRGRSWGLWLTELGRAVFDHVHGWEDAPMAVGQDVVHGRSGHVYRVESVNRLEVFLRSTTKGTRWAMTMEEAAAWWRTGGFTPYVRPLPVSPVAVGDTIRVKGESALVYVLVVSDSYVLLSNGRQYTVAGMGFLSRMEAFVLVPRTAPRLTRIKSTSGTRRRNRG